MNSSKIKIGDVENLVIFGGGLLVARIAKEAGRLGVKPYVFAVNRHLAEAVEIKNQKTFKDVLEDEGITYFNVRDINGSAELRSVVTAKTLGLGIGEVYTFNQETIDLFRGKLFDFMVIKLPQYRGGAHFTWQILRNDRTGAWNIQVINEEMVPGVYDSGAILKTREYQIPGTARLPEDYFKVSDEEGLKLFAEFMDEIKAGKTFTLAKPDEQKSLYLPRLHTLKHGLINWAWTAAELERFVCAFDEPYPGASTFLNGRRVFIKDAQAAKSDGDFHPFMAGLIYRISEGSVFVAARDGTLVIKKVLAANGEDLFKSLRTGQRLYTPASHLDLAMLNSAEYDANGLVENEEALEVNQ